VEAPHADYARIDEALRKDPSLPMRVMEQIDELAQRHDVPLEQRTYLRTTMTEMSWRFRNQRTKSVVDELVGKYDRALARSPLMGMPAGDERPAADAEAPLPPGAPEPLRAPIVAKAATQAEVQDIAKAVCSSSPSVRLGGERHPVDLEWAGPGPEPQGGCVRSGVPDAVRGMVRVEASDKGPSWRTIVVVLQPRGNLKPGDVDDLRTEVTEVAEDLAGKAEGTRLRRSVAPAPSSGPRIGEDGHACLSDDECDSTYCKQGVCADAKTRPDSAKLMKTTGKVAKVGVWLLIPPICAIGILVLLTCAFMAFTAGIMSAAGN
jgi:hypothetical protein